MKTAKQQLCYVNNIFESVFSFLVALYEVDDVFIMFLLSVLCLTIFRKVIYLNETEKKGVR